MRRYGVYIIGMVVSLVLAACEHKELCYQHPHDSRTRIEVDWSQFTKETPTGMSVVVYPQSDGAVQTVLSNTMSHVYVTLTPGLYHTLVYNQSPSEFASVLFRGLDKFATAEVYANDARSNWYRTRAGEEKLGTTPEWIGTDSEEQMEADGDPDKVAAVLTPRNIVHTITFTVELSGIHNYRSARASLTGLASGYMLGLGRTTDSEVTHLLESWTKTVDASDPTRGSITAQITCFGLPYGHTARPDENLFTLSILLADNQTVLDFPFSIGDKFGWTDKGDLHLSVHLAIDEPLPDVQPAGTSSGGFDVTVDDWGDEEQVEVDI